MDDELEEIVLKQACVSQMKFISRLAINTFGFFNKLPTNLSYLSYYMKYCLRPEVIFILGTFILLVCFYLQIYELDTNGLFSKLSSTLRFRSKKVSSLVTLAVEKDSWEEKLKQSAGFAIQGTYLYIHFLNLMVTLLL